MHIQTTQDCYRYLKRFNHRSTNRKQDEHLHTMNELLEVFQLSLSDFEFVQITGSSGKGSTAHFLSSILTVNGVKHGLFTGPHIQRYEERFQIMREPISTDSFVKLIKKIEIQLSDYQNEHVVGHMHVMILVALMYFKESEVKLIIFENGSGGKSDPSNVFNPIIGCLTEICLDHTHLLGATITDITTDKSAIIKDQTAFAVCGMFEETARALLKDLSFSNMNTTFLMIGDDYCYKLMNTSLTGSFFHFHGRKWVDDFHISLAGPFQAQNAATALVLAECLTDLGYTMNLDLVKQGLAIASLPGRFEIMPVAESTIILDGAHNQLELEVLHKTLMQYKLYPDIILLTFSSNKDLGKMIDSFHWYDAQYYLIPNPFAERRMDLHEMEMALSDAGLLYRSIPSVIDAIHQTLLLARKKTLTIVITGSLYLVGESKNILSRMIEAHDYHN